jgi:hypothetical protein
MQEMNDSVNIIEPRPSAAREELPAPIGKLLESLDYKERGGSSNG